jgi:hypothetical protein
MDETNTAQNWLNEMDRDEWAWAATYLTNRTSFQERREMGLVFNRDFDRDFNSRTSTINKLELTVNGVKLIARLRNAIRQRRYRASKGGRATCSFTLPRQTKATLKGLAKSHKTTETAVIERLIEGASLAAQDQKGEKRREAIIAKITRNSSKLAHELNGVKIDETKKHLSHCLKQLARWEIFFKDEQPELSPEDEAAANKRSEIRLRATQDAINASVAKHQMMSPRSLVDA